jgi:energy-coupling factor transporter ATP-binding protein EcfA2
MSTADPDLEVDNPFSTTRIRPGALAFQHPPGETLENLVVRLRQSNWRGQIVGPHGSGKSTLLAALLPALEQAGRKPTLISCQGGQRRMPAGFYRRGELHDTAALVVVDGYEQLGRWQRLRLKWYCRRRRAGLLVTTHAPVGLPTLCVTKPDLPLACRLVAQLLGPQQALITAEEIGQAYQNHAGDLREMFMEFYDYYEQRRLDLY